MKLPNQRPARTIADLEKRGHQSSYVRFGVGRLILCSNLLGILIAVIARTNGTAILWLIPIVFALPMLVCITFGLIVLYEYLTGEMIGVKPFRGPIKRQSPFDD